ncbi:MAG: YbaB/EbfC family nucleoid-associated protein [Anaerolineales bacterium]|nr:YbaB/EbfC family nucleoid-associated protein [Anaerolineales bacterium]
MGKRKVPDSSKKGMMAQIQKLQEELERAQTELADEVIVASAGGGAVKVTMTGTQECRAVEISASLIEERDAEMLQDLVMLAVNQAIQDSQVMAARRLGPLTGGMGLPGISG